MNRIEDLRIQTLGRRLDHDEFLYRFHKRYGKDVDLFDYEVFADSFYYALSSLVPNISDGELIVGKRGNHLSEEEMNEWLTEYKDITIQRSIRAGYGQESHMAIDYDLVLTEGLNGIISRIDKYKRMTALCRFTCLA